TAEYLVGALSALHHLHMFCDLLRQKIETDGIMAHHRFRHRADRVGQRIQCRARLYVNLFVFCTEMFRDKIRIAKFITLQIADAFEADCESLEICLPAFRKERHDERTVEAPG